MDLEKSASFKASKHRVAKGLILIGCLLVGLAVNAAERYKKAEIYYFTWNSRTFVSLTKEMIRRDYVIKIIIHGDSEVDKLVKWLQVDKFEEIDMKRKNELIHDLRLVIDLFDENNKRTTYLATYHNFGTEDGCKARKIDENFRAKFDLLSRPN